MGAGSGAVKDGWSRLRARGRPTRTRVAALHRLMGRPYNKPGPHPRGLSRPHQSLPPGGTDTPLEHES